MTCECVGIFWFIAWQRGLPNIHHWMMSENPNITVQINYYKTKRIFVQPGMPQSHKPCGPVGNKIIYMAAWLQYLFFKETCRNLEKFQASSRIRPQYSAKTQRGKSKNFYLPRWRMTCLGRTLWTWLENWKLEGGWKLTQHVTKQVHVVTENSSSFVLSAVRFGMVDIHN